MHANTFRRPKVGFHGQTRPAHIKCITHKTGQKPLCKARRRRKLDRESPPEQGMGVHLARAFISRRKLRPMHSSEVYRACDAYWCFASKMQAHAVRCPQVISCRECSMGEAS